MVVLDPALKKRLLPFAFLMAIFAATLLEILRAARVKIPYLQILLLHLHVHPHTQDMALYHK